MNSHGQKVLLMYWGSHLKSLRLVGFWRKMLAASVQRGWRCYLVMERPPEDRGWVDMFASDGIESVYLPRPRGHFDLASMRRVAALCRKLHVDVIHCENIFCSPLLGALIARVPVRIWTQQNMLVWHAEARRPTLRERISISTRVACAVATRVIAVSQATMQELLDLGISSRRLMVLHNPRPGPSEASWDRASTRASLGYAPSNVVSVSVGNTIPRKAFDLLLTSFARVYSGNPEARLLILGSYSALSEQACFSGLQAVVEREGLGSVVKFAGHVKDVPRYLQASDLFVFPTRGEACSFALLEAMEAGLPCVATRVGAAEQTIADGVNGFLVPCGDLTALTEKMQMLVGDSALRTRFARATKVPECFPTDAETGLLHLQLYESLLERGSTCPVPNFDLPKLRSTPATTTVRQ